MSYISIFILAVALSIDACVVSFSYGLKYKHLWFKNSMLIATFTGAFQGIMPVFGYFLTNIIRTYIQPYADLIVFLIFSYLGFKFIKEACQPKIKSKDKELCINLKCLFLIGIATSIDAFSAGITLSLYGNYIFKPAILIAFVTFINSYFGFYMGGRFKYFPSKNIEVTAGMLLLILGIKAILS